MAGLRLLDLVKPFASFIPEVETPLRKVPFDEKVIYTIGVGAIYLISALPLNGIPTDKLSDPFYWLRTPFASYPGTLLEFGLLPVITSAFFWQLLAGLKFVKVDFELSSDRELFQTLQKITASVLTLVYSLLLVFSGYFNPIDSFISNANINVTWNNLLIVLQLNMMSIIVSFLIEILDKNYGFGPGILAILAVNSSYRFVASLLDINSIKPSSTLFSSENSQSLGALIQTIRNFTSKSIKTAVIDSFTRVTSYNLIQIYLTLFALLLTAYLVNFRIEVPIKSSKVRTMASVYPIKLLYCGVLPVLFSFSLLYNLNIFGYAVTNFFDNALLSEYVAHFKLNSLNLRITELTHGVLYFISPSMASSPCAIGSLLRPFTFSLFIIVTSTLFAKYWVQCSGSSSKDIAKQFKEQEINLVSSRDTSKELNKIIPMASVVGNLIVAVMVCVFENLGSFGLSSGAIMGLVSGLTILETIVSEMQQYGGNSQIVQALGGQQ